jgi:hypothetical protein
MLPFVLNAEIGTGWGQDSEAAAQYQTFEAISSAFPSTPDVFRVGREGQIDPNATDGR